jgi:anti-anti-sigma factor
MLKVQYRNLGRVTFLCVQGQIVNGETEILRQAVQSQPDAGTVVLDLSRVSIVDARGLGAMLELREQVQSKGIGFKLMNVGKMVGRVLEVTRLNSVFEITSGVEFFPAASQRQPASAMRYASCA